MSRREKLESMLTDSPDDIFLQYALAMEFENEGENDKSLELHRGLMGGEPPYVPSFFMSAQQLADLDRVVEAIEMATLGIEQAKIQGDLHAAEEMRTFLDSIRD